MRTLGKKPDLNHTENQWYQYKERRVLWGVGREDGVVVSNILATNGFTDFWITQAGWLGIKIKKYLYVTSFYCEEDDPEIWQQRNQKKESAMKIRDVEKRLDGKKIRRKP
jgi:hypothetical protein